MKRLEDGSLYKAWVEAFKDAFDQEGDLEYIVRVASGKSLDQVATADDLDEAIERVISAADTDEWLNELLDAARDRRPGRRLLDQLAAELETLAAIEPDDPFTATRIFGVPMFDRADLRAKLKALRTDGAAPVLLVDGGPLSGKTWSNRLITYLAKKLDDLHHVYVDLELLRGQVVDAATLGNLIAEETEFEGAPAPNEEQPSQWSLQYCAWLGRRARAAGGQWWIVFDHVQKVTLHQSAKDLLYALGDQIPMRMPSVRLIVLSYRDPRDLAAGIGRMDWEKIPRMTINEIGECLVTFFMAEYLDRERNAGRPRDEQALMAEAVSSAQCVLDKIVDAESDRLVRMGQALTSELLPS